MSIADADTQLAAADECMDSDLERTLGFLCAAEAALEHAAATGADGREVHRLRSLTVERMLCGWLPRIVEQAVSRPDEERWAMYRDAAAVVWGCRTHGWRYDVEDRQLNVLAEYAEGFELAIGAPLA